MLRKAACCSLLLMLCASAAAVDDPAASPAQAPAAIVDHETVVVSGELPGPGLWRVTAGNGHVMHVMATLSPMPRRMQWEAGGVEATVARAGRVLLPPSFTLDAGVGMVRGLMLLPSALKLRRIPDGGSLQQALPPELYGRWLPLKQRYLGNDRGVEQWRPLFAAQTLFEAAVRKSGLSDENVVDKAVRRMAKRHGIPLKGVNYRLQLEDPKGVIRELRETGLSDVECFSRTLARIETDLEAMRQRANVWATGDVEALRALPYESQATACIEAVTSTALAQRLGVSDLQASIRQQWLDAAEETLASHATSLAMLPLSLVIGNDGWLAALEAKGYTVEAP